ncbi:MAG: TonB family protein [Planctomycetota bacterium]
MRASALTSVLFHACLVGGAWWWSGAGSARTPQSPLVVQVMLAAPGVASLSEAASADASTEAPADGAADGFDPRLQWSECSPSITAAPPPDLEPVPFEAPLRQSHRLAAADPASRRATLEKEASQAMVVVRHLPMPAPSAGPAGDGGSDPTAAKSKAGGETRAPRPLTERNLAPRYPGLARRRHLEGVAVVEMLVDAEGEVCDCRLLASSGHDLLDQCALRQLRLWRFDPALENGTPVPSAYRQEVEFRIVD